MDPDRLDSGRPDPDRPRAARVVGWVAAWVVAAAVAVTVGVLAVGSAGSSLRDRGPLGIDTQLVLEAEATEGAATVDPEAAVRRETFEGEFGAFVVECRGSYALGIEVRPAGGWRTVSFEEGPDDDVDAVLVSGSRSIELEIYCNGGVPTVGDREVNTLPQDDD